MMSVELTHHAEWRAAQRNLSSDEIEFILQNAEWDSNTGVIFCTLRRKDMPTTPYPPGYERLIGATVVLCKCGRHVITLYRDQKAYKRDRAKTKYNLKPDQGLCQHC